MNTEGYAMNGVRLSLREIRGTRNTSSYNLPFFGFFTHLRPLEDRTSSVLLSCSSVLFFLSAFVALRSVLRLVDAARSRAILLVQAILQRKKRVHVFTKRIGSS